jgi:hypothetical protein
MQPALETGENCEGLQSEGYLSQLKQVITITIFARRFRDFIWQSENHIELICSPHKPYTAIKEIIITRLYSEMPSLQNLKGYIRYT